MADADIVLCEGFKRAALPKIEIFRRAAHDTPLYASGSPEAAWYRAIVTDDESLTAAMPVLLLSEDDWLNALASLVEREIMDRR